MMGKRIYCHKRLCLFTKRSNAATHIAFVVSAFYIRKCARLDKNGRILALWSRSDKKVEKCMRETAECVAAEVRKASFTVASDGWAISRRIDRECIVVRILNLLIHREIRYYII